MDWIDKIDKQIKDRYIKYKKIKYKRIDRSNIK